MSETTKLAIWTAAESHDSDDPWIFQVPAENVAGMVDTLARGEECLKLEGEYGAVTYFPVRNILAFKVGKS